MSIEIEVLNGDASWTQAKPLFDAIWPAAVVATLPWADITFAHADLRVLACHIAEYPLDRPAAAGERLADPRHQPRQVASPVVGPDPGHAGGDHRTGNLPRGFRRHVAGLTAILAVEHRPGLLGQAGFAPVI